MMFAEEFFEKVADIAVVQLQAVVTYPIDFIMLIIAMVIGCVSWVLILTIPFLPVYYDSVIDYIKCKLNDRRSNG